MQKIFDVAVFGGGVIGASVFNGVVRAGKRCVLLELNDIASGETKANSAIIHAGFDAKEGTLKAKYNVLGSKMYPAICKRLGVPYKKCGAYVLGNDLSVIEELYNRGITNGIKKSQLEIVKGKELKNRIPNLNQKVKYGLFAKTSAIVSPYLLTICLCEEAVLNGGVCYTFFNTTSINFNGKYFEIKGNEQTICAKQIVNASGFGYNDVANLLGTEKYDIEFKRGEYFVLDHSEKDVVNATIFPLPTKDGKGILVTPTVDENILVGPTAMPSINDCRTSSDGLQLIKIKSSALIDNINLKKAIRVFAGERTIVGNDFVVEKSKINNNVINIAGICSPGLSSAPAIALDVLEMLGIKNVEVKSKRIEPYILAKDLPKAKYNALVKQDERYGKIICKCEMITEGDIVNALHRPIPVYTIDGIKRRVRAGMGRCQGGFCMDKVAKIIARENKIPFEWVKKEYPNSEIVVGDIKGEFYEN